MEDVSSAKLRARLDPDGIGQALALTAEQAASSWKDGLLVRVPQGARSVVIVGMGASALGPHIVTSALSAKLRVPVRILNGYDLPGDVDRNTLVILSSYSGTTEEILAVLKVARARKAKIAGICAGGPLAAALGRIKAPTLLFDPRFNPGNRPRLGLGYAVFGVAALLSRAKALTLSALEASDAIRALRATVRTVSPDVPALRNVAKRLAARLVHKTVLWSGAEHLEGAVHAVTNMTNETAKHLAFWLPIPELNHHFMEGLGFPKTSVKNLAAVLVRSGLYTPRVAARFPLTADVFHKNGVTVEELKLTERAPLSQAMELLMLGGHTAYFLAMAHRVNPSPNPWVDHFKKALGPP